MNWLIQKYIEFSSIRLRNFKRKSTGLYQFSCVYCGDSHTDKRKARAYLIENKNKVSYYCHNCTKSASFDKFLEELDATLYQQYKIEVVKEKAGSVDEIKLPKKVYDNGFTKPKFIVSGPLKGLKKVSQLPINHYCFQYVTNRKIPTQYHSQLFFVDKFMAYINTLIPNKFDDAALKYDEPRLIIPFLDAENNCFAVQGRSFKKKTATKYITILLDENKRKIFNLNRVNFNKTIYVFEGPIDSMFIPNSIAIAGASLSSDLKEYNKDKFVLVSDNEPRNTQIISIIDKHIKLGYKVCIWNSDNPHKDINDMIMAGYTVDKIKEIIDKNTFSGMSAVLRLSEWKKC